MPVVFRKPFCQLALFGSEKSGLELLSRGSITGKRGNASAEYESEEVIGIVEKDRIGLRPGEWQRSGDFRDAAEVVALVEVHRREHLICADRHWREEEDAVGFTLAVQQHYAIEKSVSALLRGQFGDISATNSPHLAGLRLVAIRWRGTVVESGLRKRVLWRIETASATGVKEFSGRHRKERQQRDGSQRPRKG